MRDLSVCRMSVSFHGSLIPWRRAISWKFKRLLFSVLRSYLDVTVVGESNYFVVPAVKTSYLFVMIIIHKSVFINVCFETNTVCPTRYRTRHSFNNFTTNKDIATKFEADLPHCERNVTTS